MTSQAENGEDRPIVRGEPETETRITCSSTASKSWVTIATVLNNMPLKDAF